MRIQALSPQGIDVLDDLVKRVYENLSDISNTHFFVASQAEIQDIITGEIQVIDAILDTVHENRMILDSIAGSSVVYAIWLRSSSTGRQSIHYIGHVVDAGARTRMINHFVRKHERTGAKLANVRSALAAGYEVGVSFVVIEPPTLRLYVEDVLIREKKPRWNIKSVGRNEKLSPFDEALGLP